MSSRGKLYEWKLYLFDSLDDTGGLRQMTMTLLVLLVLDSRCDGIWEKSVEHDTATAEARSRIGTEGIAERACEFSYP